MKSTCVSNIPPCPCKRPTNHSPRTCWTRFPFYYLFSSQLLFSKSALKKWGQSTLLLAWRPLFNDNSYFSLSGMSAVMCLSDHLSWQGSQTESDFHTNDQNISLGRLTNLSLFISTSWWMLGPVGRTNWVWGSVFGRILDPGLPYHSENVI